MSQAVFLPAARPAPPPPPPRRARSSDEGKTREKDGPPARCGATPHYKQGHALAMTRRGECVALHFRTVDSRRAR